MLVLLQISDFGKDSGHKIRLEGLQHYEILGNTVCLCFCGLEIPDYGV
jgi:hypothetical protein